VHAVGINRRRRPPAVVQDDRDPEPPSRHPTVGTG